MRANGKLKGVRRADQLLTALKAGLTAQLIATFLVMLAIGPYHAAHTEFPGHEHPPGTPDHVHNLEMVTGWLVVSHALVIILNSLPVVGFAFIQPDSWLPQAARPRVNGSRSPPAAILL